MRRNFFQAGVFQGHSHIYVFDDDESIEQQQQWLEEIDALCQEAGIPYVVRRYDQDGEQGFEFGFATMEDYVAFIHNAFGDLEGQHIHTHSFDDPDYQDAWRMAAEMHLQALGVNYRLEQDGNKLRFEFDRFSDRTLLNAMIAQGTIDTSARGLAFAQAYQRFVEPSVAQDFNGPLPQA